MIDFSTITAFRLVRRLAMGSGSASMYLLLWDDHDRATIESDLEAELDIQMSLALHLKTVLEFKGMNDIVDPIQAVRIDRWFSELVPLVDTHVSRLEQTGAQFLFFATADLAEQLLIEAPNFRNRLTEVLRIVPDDPSGGNVS